MYPQLSLFDLRNYEYSFMISPARRVKDSVVNMKKQINRITPVGQYDLYSVPHISLFKMRFPNNDNFILSLFKQALLYSTRFKVELNGISYFDHQNSKTVYLNIANPEPIVCLHRNLLSTFQYRTTDFIPHLTIARSIPNSAIPRVEKILTEYHDDFWCNEIIVLKKPVEDKRVPTSKYTRIYEAILN